MAENIDRYNPLGFYNLAEDFYRAAAVCQAAVENRRIRLRYDFVLYHLHTHSIELALKAFLRAHGLSVAELKKLSHGLVAIYERCVSLRMRVKKPKRTAQVAQWLDELSRTQTFRYFEMGTLTLPTLAEVQSANERILSSVQAKCAKAGKIC